MDQSVVRVSGETLEALLASGENQRAKRKTRMFEGVWEDNLRENISELACTIGARSVGSRLI